MLQPCMRVDCDAEASFSLKVLIPIVGCSFYEQVPVEFFCGLKLCPACAQRVSHDDLFTRDTKSSIRHMLRAQGQVPDFDRAKVTLISINDLQLLQLEASQATIH